MYMYMYIYIYIYIYIYMDTLKHQRRRSWGTGGLQPATFSNFPGEHENTISLSPAPRRSKFHSAVP